MAKKKILVEFYDLDHKEDSISKSLGIDQERVKFLQKEMLYMENKTPIDKFSQEIEYMAPFCESIEEIIWISFLLGTNRCSSDCPVKKAIPIPISLGNMPPELRRMLEHLENKYKGLFGPPSGPDETE